MVLHTHSRWKVVTNCYSKVLSNASEELLLDDKYQNIFTGFTEHIPMKQNHPVIVCKSMSSDKCNPHPKTSLLSLPSAWKPTIYFLSYCFFFSGFSVSGIRVVGCLCLLLSFSIVSVAFISRSLLFVDEYPIPSYGHSTAPLSIPVGHSGFFQLWLL